MNGSGTNQVYYPRPINYPKNLKLWEININESDKLKIINPGDFPKQEILDGLGISSSPLISSFGITNAEEIKERQSILRFLADYPDIDTWIRGGNIPFDFPRTEDDFLLYFDPSKPHTPYWNGIRKLIAMLNTPNSPKRIEALSKVLSDSLVLEEDEKILSRFVTDRITNIAVIEGTIDYTVIFRWCDEEPKQDQTDKDSTKRLMPTGIEDVESHVHGHRMYSLAVTDATEHKYPNWTKQKFNPLNWIGINRIAKKITNWRNRYEKSKAYNEMVIDQASYGLKRDIQNELKKKLEALNWSQELSDMTVTFKVYFSYSKVGLRIKIYGSDPLVSLPDTHFEFDNYDGYSKERLSSIREAMYKYTDGIFDHRQSRAGAKLMLEIEKQDSAFFNKTLIIPSPYTDKEHRWFALINLYTDQTVKNIYEESLNHRKFFREQMKRLRSVADLGQKLRQKAITLGTSICFPEIVEDGHSVVAFDELYPIHLLSQLNGKTLVPIKGLAPINGQIIGFTGYHGGGKTVAALSISDNIFLAQSGLPIFGQNFRLNPKKILGLVFIERGEGSTCELLLKKIRNILTSIKGIDGNKIVLILDELGSATQESSGYELGKDLLTSLSKMHASVLFSTQIMSLAEFAEQELEGICYKFNSNHSMDHGIGDGGMENLRNRMGINKLLK